MNDPVFGALEGGEPIWNGSSDATILGADIPVLVDVPLREVGRELVAEKTPTDVQRAAFQKFLQAPASVLPEAERGLFDHYRDVADTYREGMTPDEVQASVPELATSGEIWALLSSPSVYVPDQRDPSRLVVMLDWECTWETGIRVALVNNKPEAVLAQGEMWE